MRSYKQVELHLVTLSVILALNQPVICVESAALKLRIQPLFCCFFFKQRSIYDTHSYNTHMCYKNQFKTINQFLGQQPLAENMT